MRLFALIATCFSRQLKYDKDTEHVHWGIVHKKWDAEIPKSYDLDADQMAKDCNLGERFTKRQMRRCLKKVTKVPVYIYKLFKRGGRSIRRLLKKGRDGADLDDLRKLIGLFNQYLKDNQDKIKAK